MALWACAQGKARKKVLTRFKPPTRPRNGVVVAAHTPAHLVHLREQLVHALLALGELLLLSDREWRARQLLRRRIVLLLLSLALANDQRGRWGRGRGREGQVEVEALDDARLGGGRATRHCVSCLSSAADTCRWTRGRCSVQITHIAFIFSLVVLIFLFWLWLVVRWWIRLCTPESVFSSKAEAYIELQRCWLRYVYGHQDESAYKYVYASETRGEHICARACNYTIIMQMCICM